MTMRLAWGGWLYGLFAAIIGGGAGAAGTGVAQVVVDPQHSDIRHLLALMGTSFVVTGLLSAFAFLKQSPLPQVETVEQVKNIQPEGQGVKITSTTTTTQEPPKTNP